MQMFLRKRRKGGGPRRKGGDEVKPSLELTPKQKSSSAKVVEVIEVATVTGKGTAEHPFQNIIEYWSLDGKLLAVTEMR